LIAEFAAAQCDQRSQAYLFIYLIFIEFNGSITAVTQKPCD